MATKTKTKSEEKAAKPEPKVTEPTYTAEELLNYVPGPLKTVGNRDGELMPVAPEQSIEDWKQYRKGADKVVEDIMNEFPEDPQTAAEYLTIIATYETHDVNSWADAAQAAGIVEVAQGKGPQSARTRYERIVPDVSPSLRGATNVGQWHRKNVKAAFAEANPEPETTEDDN